MSLEVADSLNYFNKLTFCEAKFLYIIDIDKKLL